MCHAINMNERPPLIESQKQLVRLQAQVDTLQAEKQAWVEDKLEMQISSDYLLAELKLSQSPT